MMEQNLNKEYEKLIAYFESQKIKEKSKVKLDDFKKPLSDLKNHSYVPNDRDTEPNALSVGFSIKKFETMMRTKLIEEHKKMQSYDRPYISVSELIGCSRQVYYNRMHYDVDLNKVYNFSYLYLIQKVGNVVHEVIQSLYDFNEIEKTIISERFKVKGRVDAIKDRFLCEIKTFDSDSTTFSKEHFLQGNIYAYILNNEYQYKIDTITIIYAHRNLKKIIPYDIPIDNSIAESYLKKGLKIKNAIDSKKVIEPYGSNENTCRFCLYKGQCAKDKTREVPIPFVKKETKKIIEDDDRNAFLL